jgi:hypothetical protein
VFLKRLLNRLVFLIQLVLVALFIVFEEVIWEGIAKPIYDYIHELHILQTIQRKLQSVNRYVILVLFLVLLFGVEGAGLVAGVLAVRGMVITAALLYGAKIPIAAFTFWLFHATEEKLLSFGWFRVAYEKIVAFFAWIKEREIYRNTVRQAREIKTWVKKSFAQFKAKYLSGDNTLSKRFGRLYRMVKRSVKR